MPVHPMSTPEPHVIGAGLRLLQGRERTLERHVVMLRRSVDDGEPSSEALDIQRAAISELTWLRAFLRRAVVRENPGDPEVVEAGDRVTLRFEDAGEETFVLVHAVEAAIDARRISLDSPLAQALLHRRVGDTVEVLTPSGRYRCTIAGAGRDEDVE